jgi:primosomal protein N' (replication factor Y)
MFAVVAVNAAVHGGGTAHKAKPAQKSLFPGPVFHYDIPDELEEQVIPGVLVEVPFGPRQVQGLVISISETAPVPETRPVTGALVDEPLLGARQLALGMWLSEYYFSPLVDCLRLTLPPGILRQPRPVVRLHPEATIPDELPAAQRQVVELLQQRGTLSAAQIGQRMGRDRANRAIRSLTRRGILIRGSELPSPRARPKRVNFVRLLASPPQVAGIRPLLGRHSRQATVLQTLVDTDDPLPATEHILEQAQASKSTLTTMAHKGWIDIASERALILLQPGADDADLGRAAKQQAIVDYLGERNVPVEERALRETIGASAATLNALLERGLIKRLDEPSTTTLLLDEEQARQQIIELRGAHRQHQVLDYLLSRPAGEWVWVSWVYAETDAKLADLRALDGHGLIELAEREVWRDPLADQAFVLESAPRLTPDQQRVWEAIKPYVEGAASLPDIDPPVFLLHGVTGSGKTEIYLRAVEATLQRGRQAIVLVPEISLTPQTIRRFAARFPEGLGIIHSGLSDGERYDTWRRIRAGQIHLVIGPRSALFAPMPDVGLIVLDEEHESSYKQSDTAPTYHARDVALQVSKLHEAAVLLGSATPDLVTYHRACETRAIRLLELPQRLLSHRQHLQQQQTQLSLPEVRYRPLGPGYEDVYTTDLPPVRVVDMRHELRVGNRSMFSRALQGEMKRALSSKEQAILFLNRRGASTFVMCRDCGTVIRCPRCDIPLTFHLTGERLTCHHCNHRQPVPDTCPICQSRRIKHFGAGTERVETAVRELLPAVRILRWDRDTTREKGSHQALLDRFMRHEADVLIGTQMIAKGLDLPLVTLVGVISADTALNLPDFRAAERTFQLLAQVAGRAGRGPRGGQVIVQTYTPEHYAIQAASKHDYATFYGQERAFRHQLGYPPFARLARLLYSDPDVARCQRQARDLADTIAGAIQDAHLRHLALIGPAPCFLSRLRGRWRWQIILRATHPGHAQDDELHMLLRTMPLPAGWRLDVDPLDIL